MGAGVFAGTYGKAGQSRLLRHPGGSTGHFRANTAMCCAQHVGERPENLKGAARLPAGKPWGTGRSWRAVNQAAGKNGIDKFCANTAMCCAQRVGERPENLKERRTVTDGEAVGDREQLAGGQASGG